MSAGTRDAAAALYAMPPAGFVAEWTARAKAARADGDRELAARIGALQKPSAAAWLVNLLVRDDPGELDRVLELGAALRSAQQGADRERLRELGGRRRELLGAVTDRAVRLAEQVGHAASAAAIEEFQQTVQAALADEDAAEAAGSGRLVRALRADGLGAVDLTDAVGGPGRHRSIRPPTTVRGTGGESVDAADVDRRQQDVGRRAGEHARRVEETERRADEARQRDRDARSLVVQRERIVGVHRARVQELHDLLDPAETALAEATAALADARVAAEDAAHTLSSAEQEAERVR